MHRELYVAGIFGRHGLQSFGTTLRMLDRPNKQQLPKQTFDKLTSSKYWPLVNRGLW